MNLLIGAVVDKHVTAWLPEFVCPLLLEGTDLFSKSFGITCY